MLTKVWSVASMGLQAIEIEVEVNVAVKGFPGLSYCWSADEGGGGGKRAGADGAGKYRH